jgi:hypothetical protein
MTVLLTVKKLVHSGSLGCDGSHRLLQEIRHIFEPHLVNTLPYITDVHIYIYIYIHLDIQTDRWVRGLFTYVSGLVICFA